MPVAIFPIFIEMLVAWMLESLIWPRDICDDIKCSWSRVWMEAGEISLILEALTEMTVVGLLNRWVGLFVKSYVTFKQVLTSFCRTLSLCYIYCVKIRVLDALALSEPTLRNYFVHIC